MRNRDIGAGQAKGRQTAHGSRQCLGRHRERHIGAVDAVAGKPMAVQLG